MASCQRGAWGGKSSPVSPLPHFSLSLVLLAALSGAAYGRTIEGSVRERGTRAPIPAALVYVVEHDVEAFTDEQGAFVVSLPDGRGPAELTVRLDSPGYVRSAELVRLPAGASTAKADLYLVPTDEAGGVTRIRERRSAADVARGTHRISGREVNEMPGTYGDPAKAIENFPGMGRVRRSQGALLVRGATPGETAVFVDDFEVPDLYHFTGSTSVINLPFVDSVELVPGAFSARYGRATGGLIVLHTRKLPTDDIHGFGKLDVIDGGAYVGVPLSERAAVGVSARRSWLDGVRQTQRALSPSDDIVQVPTYWDYQLKLDWDVASGHELVVFTFGSGDRELYIRDASEAFAAHHEINDSDFHRIGMRYRHVLGGGFTHTITPAIGYERRQYDLERGLERRERDTFDAALREDLTWRGEDARVSVGIDATARADLFRFGGLLAAPALRALPSADLEGQVRRQTYEDTALRGTFGVYAEGTFDPLARLSVTPGLRLDAYWYEEAPVLSIEPRVAASYEVTQGEWGLTLKAGSGVFARPPEPDDVVAARRYGRRLGHAQAMHLQGGMEQRLGVLGAFSATVFSITRDSAITRSDTFPSPQSPLVSPVAMSGASLSTGVEVLVRLPQRPAGWGWVSYTLARHELRDGPSPYAVRYAYPSEFDTTHLLSFVGQTRLPWGFRLGGRYRVATGMPFTPVSGGLFDADSGRYLPLQAARGSQRFEVFQALDVRLDYALLLPWLECVFYADLVNAHSLLNSALPVNAIEDLRYSADYSQVQEVRGLPLIPAAGLKVTF
jgi:outer membrane receptor protein involved in Fe transport